MKRRREKGDGADQSVTISASDADIDCFARAMADVVRLAPDPRGRVPAARHLSAPRAAALPAPLPAGQHEDDTSEAGFVAPGVDRRELRKLNRGEHVPGRRLDLHGMTADEALANVKRFLDHGRHRYRCLCIVHGRGLHSEGNVSILKTRVRQYLRQHRGVLAYANAPRAAGGTGAVYVLLRK